MSLRMCVQVHTCMHAWAWRPENNFWCHYSRVFHLAYGDSVDSGWLGSEASGILLSSLQHWYYRCVLLCPAVYRLVWIKFRSSCLHGESSPISKLVLLSWGSIMDHRKSRILYVHYIFFLPYFFLRIVIFVILLLPFLLHGMYISGKRHNTSETEHHCL